MDKRYIITGAAGHLGGTILSLLAERGCEIRGLLLPGQQARFTASNVRYVFGDICKPDSMRPLFEGSREAETVVIHTAARISIARRLAEGVYDANVRGTRNVLSLCREYGVRRLVHVSSVHAIPELENGRTMVEVDSFSPDRVIGGYAKTKSEAAQAVLDAVSEGLDAVLVFPSGIIGPNDRGENHLVQLLVDYMKGRLRACVRGGYNFVDVRDVAAGCIRAAEYGRRGEGYILSGHYASIGDLLKLASPLCPKRRLPELPIWLARLAVPFVELYAKIRRKRPLYTAYSLHTLGGNSRFSCEKARSHLGYTVRELCDTVRDTVVWLRKNVK